ncbi:MAG: DUF4397 domain-containing protein [Gemmatimonadaceae bacterium]|nr:DUF4397 domain-containing protein [Gemmatimonadaceae bacterium]
MNTYRIALALLCTAAVSACGDNAVQKITSQVPGANVKFYNLGVGSPDVNFYANTTKVTASASSSGTEATTGVAYGKQSSGGFYTGIVPGSYTLAGKIAAATDKDLAISTIATTLADGKYYSYFQSGFYNTTAKTVESFLVEDPFISGFDFTVAYVRFVNASPNSQPMILYAKQTTTLVEVPLGAAVAYKSAGAFTALPSGVYDLGTRAVGSSTNLISSTKETFFAGGVYTVVAYGDMTVTSTTSAARPQLISTLNR